MSRHAYPASAMVGDYARAAAGLVPAAVILAIEPVGLVAGAVLSGLAALFAYPIDPVPTVAQER